MFSQVSVILLRGEEGPITHDALPHGYPPRDTKWDMIPDMGPTLSPLNTRHGPTPLLLTSGGYHWRPGTYPLPLTTGGHHWRPVKTCSL